MGTMFFWGGGILEFYLLDSKKYTKQNEESRA